MSRTEASGLSAVGAALMVVMAVLVAAPAVTAQQTQTQVMRFEAGSVVILNEIGAIVMQEGDSLKFGLVDPPEMRSKEYRDVDIMEGDAILMVNGKFVKSATALQELYDALEPGDALKFGLRRGRDTKMASLTKADFSGQGEGQMMMVMGGDGEPGGQPVEAAQGMGAHVQTITLGGDGAEVVDMIDAGLILTGSSEGVTVAMVFPDAGSKLEGTPPTTNDAVTAFNGEKIESAETLKKMYAAAAIGDKITLTVEHSGEAREITFVKAKAPEGMMIKR